MHIHKIKFGKHVKRLLRVSRRDGRHVKKFTVLNLSNWADEQVTALELALRNKRAVRGTPLENDADIKILNLLMTQIPAQEQWRIYSFV